MKLIGLLLLVLCSTFIGLNEAGKLRQRQKEAGEIVTLIQQIKIRLNFSAASTMEILNEIKNFEEIRHLPFVKRAAEHYEAEAFDLLWEREVRFSNLSISADDIAMLISFGQSLGTTDLEGQLELCNIFDNRFQERFTCYSNEYKKKSKLYISLGFFLGLGAAVVLI